MMDFKNLLTSGHAFDEHESYLAFKFRVLNYFMLVAIVFGIIIGLLGDMGIMKIGTIMPKADYIYALLNIVLLWQLRKDKNLFAKIAWLQVGATWLVCLVALLSVETDEFRIIWFFVSVYIAFLLLGVRAGIAFVLLSICVIVLANSYIDIHISETAVMTALFAMTVFGLLSSSYTLQMSSYENKLSSQNEKLEVTIREMNEALELAYAANQIKNLFLANMSHEIRTPMNGVLSMVQVLQTTGLDEQQRSYLKSVERSSQTLLTLLDDLLDLSRIESGKLEIVAKEFITWECLEDVMNQVDPLFEDKPVELRIDVSNDLPTYLVGDEVRLKQVIVNLVSNAAKFTHEGEVDVTISGQRAEGNQYHLHVEVTDTGIGIPQEKIPSIFEPFQQLSPDRIANKGVGLGLPICKKIIEAMHGELQASSVVGKGSTFYIDVTLPIAQQHGTAKPVPAAGGILENLDILLVDDDKISRLAVKTLLNNKGHEVVIAENGAEAIYYLEQNDRFDIVLMDVHMPVMNGVTATKVIKERQLTSAPVIGMTASVMNDERENYFEAGMDALVEKPVNFDNLVEIMRRKVSS
ncbi:MAG: ATP-binding protein [Thioalkalispiraceae bacterium]|jgi:signal transduction histidine kinase/CheY-like chemotaxis protein